MKKYQLNWVENPVEVEDPVKKYFIDDPEGYKMINTENVTYIEKGSLLINDLINLTGYMGENHNWDGNNFFGRYRKEEWDNFLNDVKSNGLNHPIELVVDKEGTVRIHNGNHRVKAAKQIGLSDIPVIVKYRDNSEKL